MVMYAGPFYGCWEGESTEGGVFEFVSLARLEGRVFSCFCDSRYEGDLVTERCWYDMPIFFLLRGGG